MVNLRQDRNGNYIARKRLPDDVREEYGQRYGARHEAKFLARASEGAHEAKQKFREWDSEVTARIAAIRAAQKGEGVPLTRQQARALAGEWYVWFVARHPLREVRTWEDLRDRVQEALKDAVGEAEWDRCEPDDLWRKDGDLRRAVRPVLADVGETAQFLAGKHLTLNREAHDQFLDWLYDDLAAAFRRMIRVAHGDYGDDKYVERFPKFEGLDAGETPQQLFEKWVAARKPALSTQESWSTVFRAIARQFPERSAASISPEEAQEWITSLIGEGRSARTVDNNYLTAAKTVFGWAKDHKRIPRNPFASVKVTVPRAVKLRERAFRSEESRTILKAALSIANTDTPTLAARRWVPWLCAYTGARPGEITQLRGTDVVQEDGIWALRITPDAGAVKGGQARMVPLHEHLIAQGFLSFAKQHGAGPLFYRPAKQADSNERARGKKPRAVQARQRLASWVRSLGITDKGLSPNHAWRHTFKRQAARSGIEPGMRDAICGHSPRAVADEYEVPTLEDMAAALKKFPRYEV